MEDGREGHFQGCDHSTRRRPWEEYETEKTTRQENENRDAYDVLWEMLFWGFTRPGIDLMDGRDVVIA